MESGYYVPHKTYWPILGSIGLFCLAIGAGLLLHSDNLGLWVFLIGSFFMAYMMFGWFGEVIRENRSGRYNAQVDDSFRWGMIWFIFSEVMFFAAFFGALFYIREYSVPWLAGGQAATHAILWPHFQAAWPLFQNPNPQQYVGPKDIIAPWGIPTLNTFLLMSSAAAVTWSLGALKQKKREQMVAGLMLTIILGLIFLGCQAHEYMLAYHEYGLKLSSGVYGTTFFMLTGFHGMHVMVGLIMLITILVRCLKGDFTPEDHFGFEACAWYWHFVDVVWMFLFVLVYIF